MWTDLNSSMLKLQVQFGASPRRPYLTGGRRSAPGA